MSSSPAFAARPIHDVRAGDVVLWTDPVTRAQSPKNVVRVLRHPDLGDRLLHDDGTVTWPSNPPYVQAWTPPGATVRYVGKPGTFGTVPTHATNSSGDTVGVYSPSSWELTAGQSFWFPVLAPNGHVLIPGSCQTADAFKPTALTCQMFQWVPPDGSLTVESIPTTTGKLSAASTVWGVVGGADFEDVGNYVDSGSVARIVACVGRGYNEFVLGDGEWPVIVVFSLDPSGLWLYDAARSKTPAQIQAAAPALASGVFDNFVSVTGDTHVGSRNMSELETFPLSGYTIFSHYDNAPGIGQQGGVLTVFDKDMVLAAKFYAADVTHPVTGDRVSCRFRGLSMVKASSAVADDERVTVEYDAFVTPTGVNGAVSDASAGGAFTTPKTSNLNPGSSTIEITCRMLATDWTPAADSLIGGVWENTSNQREWGLFLDSTGKLSWRCSADGTAVTINQASTSATGNTDGTRGWVGISFNNTTGALSIYKAADALTEPSRWAGWTLISSHTPGTVAFFSATAALSIMGTGSFFNARLSGAVYQFSVYVGGSQVVNANFGAGSAVTPGASPVTDAGGRVWTPHGNAAISSAANSCVQEFSWKASTKTLTAKSAPVLLLNRPTFRPEQTTYDDEGALMVVTTFQGLFNGFLEVFRPGTLASGWPSSAAAWSNGLGGATTEWAVMALPQVEVVPPGGLAIGATGGPVVQDPADGSYYQAVGTSGVLRYTRGGTPGARTWAFDRQYGNFIDELGGGPGKPLRGIVDTANGMFWFPVRRPGGTPHPQVPAVIDQWVGGVRLVSAG